MRNSQIRISRARKTIVLAPPPRRTPSTPSTTTPLDQGTPSLLAAPSASSGYGSSSGSFSYDEAVVVVGQTSSSYESGNDEEGATQEEEATQVDEEATQVKVEEVGGSNGTAPSEDAGGKNVA